MRRRMVYVEKSDEGWNFGHSSAQEASNNSNAVPIVFAGADRITGIGTPFLAPAAGEAPGAPRQSQLRPHVVRSSDHRTLLESAGGLAFMSTPGTMESSAQATLESLARTKFLLCMCISIDVLFMLCLTVATIVQVAARDAGTLRFTEANTLPDVVNPDWIALQPNNDENAGLGTARFKVRAPILSQHLLNLGSGDATELIAVAPLAIHVAALLLIHLLGFLSAWRGWTTGLSGYIGLLLAFNIARLAGAGVLVGRMSLGDVDAGGAPTFWFALRAIGDIFCVFIASHLRSKMSTTWFISFRSRLRL